MARRVDDLGRIVLPVEMRRMFGIRAGDELEIGVEGGAIFLRKVEARCVFCDQDEGLRPYRDKKVCAACADHVSALVAPGTAVASEG
jgi:transcriptional pleiotropic regulator of transition state genes